jgi:hypothetical protein
MVPHEGAKVNIARRLAGTVRMVPLRNRPQGTVRAGEKGADRKTPAFQDICLRGFRVFFGSIYDAGSGGTEMDDAHGQAGGDLGWFFADVTGRASSIFAVDARLASATSHRGGRSARHYYPYRGPKSFAELKQDGVDLEPPAKPTLSEVDLASLGL